MCLVAHTSQTKPLTLFWVKGFVDGEEANETLNLFWGCWTLFLLVLPLSTSSPGWRVNGCLLAPPTSRPKGTPTALPIAPALARLHV